jgi:hypothetical protein
MIKTKDSVPRSRKKTAKRKNPMYASRSAGNKKMSQSMQNKRMREARAATKKAKPKSPKIIRVVEVSVKFQPDEYGRGEGKKTTFELPKEDRVVGFSMLPREATGLVGEGVYVAIAVERWLSKDAQG